MHEGISMGIRKIAILTHDIEGGAFSNLATSLARGFDQLGFESDLVVLNVTETAKREHVILFGRKISLV